MSLKEVIGEMSVSEDMMKSDYTARWRCFNDYFKKLGVINYFKLDDKPKYSIPESRKEILKQILLAAENDKDYKYIRNGHYKKANVKKVERFCNDVLDIFKPMLRRKDYIDVQIKLNSQLDYLKLNHYHELISKQTKYIVRTGREFFEGTNDDKFEIVDEPYLLYYYNSMLKSAVKQWTETCAIVFQLRQLEQRHKRLSIGIIFGGTLKRKVYDKPVLIASHKTGLPDDEYAHLIAVNTTDTYILVRDAIKVLQEKVEIKELSYWGLKEIPEELESKRIVSDEEFDKMISGKFPVD